MAVLARRRPTPGAARGARLSAMVIDRPPPRFGSCSAIGASGCSSIDGGVGAPGRSTAATMAWATPAGRMKLEWRASPHRTHCSMTSAVTSGSQSMPMPVRVGPGPHDGGPHAGALELHLQGADVALEPPLGGHVGGHGRPGSLDDVGGDEHDVAAAGAPTMAGTRARTRRWVPIRLTPRTRRSLGVGVAATGSRRIVLSAALDTRISTVARAASTAALANCSTDVGVGQVEVDGHRLAAARPGWPPPSPRTPSTRRAPRTTGWPGAARASAVACADARRGAGDHGRPARRDGARSGPSAPADQRP